MSNNLSSNPSARVTSDGTTTSAASEVYPNIEDTVMTEETLLKNVIDLHCYCCCTMCKKLASQAILYYRVEFCIQPSLHCLHLFLDEVTHIRIK